MNILAVLFARQEYPIQNYYGGTNPIVVIILAILAGAVVLTGIYYLIRAIYRQFRFRRICRFYSLSGAEIGLFKEFIRRLHIKDPLDILSKRAVFDEFVRRVGHVYEGRMMSEEDLVRETLIFDQIRKKLKFTYDFKQESVVSSHALPNGHSIRVMLSDEKTKQTTTFDSKILANHEFFLGIIPSDDQMDREITAEGKPPCEVFFSRDDSCEYSFESNIIRIINYPKKMLLIRHSSAVRKEEAPTNLDLPATILIGGKGGEDASDFSEYDTELDSLSYKGCTFALPREMGEIQREVPLLVSFDLKEQPMTCRGVIAQMTKQSKTFIYHVKFTSLSREDSRELLHFTRRFNS